MNSNINSFKTYIIIKNQFSHCFPPLCSQELRVAEQSAVFREQPDSRDTADTQPGVTAEEVDVDTVEIDVWCRL